MRVSIFSFKSCPSTLSPSQWLFAESRPISLNASSRSHLLSRGLEVQISTDCHRSSPQLIFSSHAQTSYPIHALPPLARNASHTNFLKYLILVYQLHRYTRDIATQLPLKVLGKHTEICDWISSVNRCHSRLHCIPIVVSPPRALGHQSLVCAKRLIFALPGICHIWRGVGQFSRLRP